MAGNRLGVNRPPSMGKGGVGSVKGRVYKGGVEYKGRVYPSKYRLWVELGKVPLGTFKSRLHRGFSLEKALAEWEIK